MMMKINKTITSLLFLFKVISIFVTEGVKYILCRNYSSFIDNLTMRLSSINILYVKVFQAFALNNSLIDEEVNNKLLKFTDNAPWDYSDIHLSELIEIANRYDLYLQHGYEVPINSGMISIVFKVYKNNVTRDPIIIKMKRKNIQQKLDEAIDNLLFFVYILSFIPIINKYQLGEVVNKNVEIIRHQTNFLEEIDNMNKVRENCKHLKYVKIPYANRKITEIYPNVIVMDYIEGLKINQVKREDYEPFSKLIVKFGLVTSIVHGLTHGDLHSGNILFIKDEKDDKYLHKIGVIDFGIIYEVGSHYKGLMFDVLTQIFDLPPKEAAIKLLNSNIIEPKGILEQIPREDYNNIVSCLETIIIETIHGKKADQIQIYKFISKLKEHLSKKELSNMGIQLSDDFVKSQLVLAMAHGLTLTLCNGNFIPLMDKCLNELFKTHLLF